MIPQKSGILEEINKLQEEKKLQERELEKFLETVREIRKEVEDIDARIKSQWSVYNKFYKKDN